ncbi:MAG: T9SS type A sorting domain-containing protein, partial [Lentimicrobiaceae bacterium]|nr:T9SS type A sorting domain-containing protein [Lentimicrobiaceae bacterium]
RENGEKDNEVLNQSKSVQSASSVCLKNEITLIPNPTTGELQVTSYGLQVTDVEIFDVYGRNVGAKFPSNKLEGWQPKADGVVFNISHLQSGIYFVRITTEEGIITKKIVKQ